MAFLFSLAQAVTISESGHGTVIGRSEYEEGENRYLVERRSTAGGTQTAWWSESVLTACGTKPAVASGPVDLVFEAPPIDYGCLQSDVIWLKTYVPDGADGHIERTVELHEALRPEITSRLAAGSAFQLVFWGQFRTPKLMPQEPAPSQPLTTRSCATGNGPEPCNGTTSIVSETVVPATGQA